MRKEGIDMKYRSDFVTNSSSSSFIVVFDNELEIVNVILAGEIVR